MKQRPWSNADYWHDNCSLLDYFSYIVQAHNGLGLLFSIRECHTDMPTDLSDGGNSLAEASFTL